MDGAVPVVSQYIPRELVALFYVGPSGQDMPPPPLVLDFLSGLGRIRLHFTYLVHTFLAMIGHCVLLCDLPLHAAAGSGSGSDTCQAGELIALSGSILHRLDEFSQVDY